MTKTKTTAKVPPAAPPDFDAPAVTGPEEEGTQIATEEEEEVLPPMAAPIEGAGGHLENQEQEEELDGQDKPTYQKNRSKRFDGKKALEIVSPYGISLRRKRAVDIGLSELILPPWTKGVQAVYQTIASDKIDPATGQKPDPKDVVMEGTYVLYDKFEGDPFKKSKLMRNLGRPSITKDQLTGKDIVEDNVMAIEFIAGMKRIDVNRDYRGYVFMELHPLNASNKHRPNDATPFFRRIDIRVHKSPASLAAELDLADDAANLLATITDKNQIIGLSVAAGLFQQGLDPGALKNTLRIWARNNPKKFFGLNNNPRPAIKLNILDAMTLGIIEYQQHKNMFVLGESGEKIFVHSVGKDGIEEFTNAMALPENAKQYETLASLIDYWE